MNPLLLSAIIRSSRESSESSSNSYIGLYKWDFRDYLTMSTFILLMAICFYMLITTSMNFNTYKYYMQYKNVTREEIAEYSNTINNELVKKFNARIYVYKSFETNNYRKNTGLGIIEVSISGVSHRKFKNKITPYLNDLNEQIENKSNKEEVWKTTSSKI